MPNGFNEGNTPYERIVLERLGALNERVNRIESQIEKISDQIVLARIDVANLKVKSGIWGAAAGMVPALVTGLLIYMQAGGIGG